MYRIIIAGLLLCGAAGAEEAEALLAPIYAARDEVLPVGTVFAKIEEGLAAWFMCWRRASLYRWLGWTPSIHDKS